MLVPAMRLRSLAANQKPIDYLFTFCTYSDSQPGGSHGQSTERITT
jgi:hypothetical protein